MSVEAETIGRHVLANLPEASRLDETDLARLLDSVPLGPALEICCRCVETREPSRPLVEKIAGLLVTTQRWDLLEKMPPALALFPDAPAARTAAQLMHAGDWEAALEALKSVRRTSPYAPARVLCRAMVCFYAGDDAGMRRALGMIGTRSPFYPVAQAMDRDVRRIDGLWEHKPCSEAQVEALLDHLGRRRVKPAAAVIAKMAGSIFPQDVHRAAGEILMALWPLALTGRLPHDDFERLAGALLPGRRAKWVLAKFDYYQFDFALFNTARYIEVLDSEYSDPSRRAKAASLVLTHTYERLRHNPLPLIPKSILPAAYRKAIGLHSDDHDVNLLEMLARAIELDPRNRAAYELLAGAPRYSRQAKAVVEAGLERMAVVFSEDPFPRIELASLYYEKNAYRKAERVLAEAKRIAPHDVLVGDRHVQALLISSEKSIKGGKMHLAADDLQKARDLCTDRTVSLVTAKTIRFQAENSGQMSLFSDNVGLTPEQWFAAAKRALALLSPFQRLTALGFIDLDMGRGNARKEKSYQRQLGNLFRRFRDDVRGLTRREIRDLLLPLAKELRPVVPSLRRAGLFLGRCPGLLDRIQDADVAPVLEAMIDEGLFAPAKKEILRRLKQKGPPARLELKFYLVVVKHLKGELKADTRAFDKVTDAACGKDRELMRAAARRLAVHAPGRLGEALRRFDFDILQHPVRPFGDVGGPSGGEDDEAFGDPEFDGFDMLPMLLAGIPAGGGAQSPIVRAQTEAVIAKMEKMLDDLELRGAPGFVIREVRGHMKRDLKGPSMFDAFAQMLSPTQVEGLSAEAWEFLFGK